MRRNAAGVTTKIYQRFRGVDFSTDPALVDDARSPWAPNIYADQGGMPCKRPGWRTVADFGTFVPPGHDPPRINGLFRVKIQDEEHLLCHAGTELFRWSEEGDPEELFSDLPDERSAAVFLGDCLWIFTGAGLLRYDGNDVTDAALDAHVPLTVIGSSPAGGGETYEAVNLLTGQQKVGFLANGSDKTYHLPYANVDSVDLVEVNGTAMRSGWTADPNAGTVTFTTAPAAPSAGAEDNVFITFTKTVSGYADRIGKCRFGIVWGVGGAADRIVASGNPDYPNQDWICAYKDPTYWPDTSYAVCGTTETAILGYRRWGEQLAVIKEDNGQDSTVFLRSGSLDENGEAVFTVKPCLSGVGAVSRFGFGSIGSEQLILTGGGIYALTNNILTAERICQNRSFRIDPRLTAEDLSEAVCCTFDGCFLVFVDGKVYGMDGRQQKAYPSRNDTEFLYECFYWENIPARCVLRVVEDGKEDLFFGGDDGKVRKLNCDVEGMARYSDDGEAITAIWSTKADDDGDPMIYKTLLKKGNAVTIKPYNRSSAKILFRTDQDAVAWQAAEGQMDIFDWEDIDFSRFTFNANDGPQEIPLNRKVKNYKRLQILVKNDAVNEGFGVYAVTKHFVTGNFAKR